MARRILGLVLIGLLIVPALLSALSSEIRAQTEKGWTFEGEINNYETAWSGTHNNTTISDKAVLVQYKVHYNGQPALGVTVIANITDPDGSRYWFKDGTCTLKDTVRYNGRDDTGIVAGEVIGGTTNDGIYANLIVLGSPDTNWQKRYGQQPGWKMNITFYYPGRPVASTQNLITVQDLDPNHTRYISHLDLDSKTTKNDWIVWARPNQTIEADISLNAIGQCDLPEGCLYYIDAWMAPYVNGEKEIPVGYYNLSSPGGIWGVSMSWNFTAPTIPGVYTISICGSNHGWWPLFNESVLFVGKIIVGNRTTPKAGQLSPTKGSMVPDYRPTLSWNSSGFGPSVPTYFLMLDDINGSSMVVSRTNKTSIQVQTTGKRHQFWSVIAYDGFNKTSSDIWDFTVKGDVNVDVAPNVTLLQPNNKDKLPDYWVNFSWKGSDPDGDPITYVLQVMYKSNKTIIVNKELTENKTRVFLPEGNFTWTVIPKDPWKTGTCSNGEWNLTVFIPSITQPWSVLLNSIDFRWDGFDPGGDKLQYKLEVRDQVSGDLYVERYTYDKNLTLWLPPWRYTWTIIPFDGVTWGWCKNGTWSIIVSGPVNLPPVISSPPAAKAWAGRQYSYQVLASDPDKDYLTYSLMEGPSNMTIDDRSGLVTWTPGTQDIGTRSITIVVIDGHGGKATQNYIILVSLVPEPVKTKTQAETSLLVFIVIIFALVGVMVTLSARHHRRS
jgi:hypothetical protein